MASDVREDRSPAEELLSKYLPLPYRVAILIVFGSSVPNPIEPNQPQNLTTLPAFYLYALNLRHLTTHGIDVPSLLRYHPSPHAHASVTRLALVLFLPLLLSISAHALYPSTFWPISYLFYIPLALSLPISTLSRRGRGRFLSTLKRVSVGGLATDNEGRFADILVADVLTSYAKPVADLWVVACAVVTGQGVLGVVDRTVGGKWVVPGLIAWPFL
jgi:hypothetical protein